MPSGYYIIPVYDQAQYSLRLKGPAGWHFSPASAPITIADGKCNDGHDINFELSGFQVTGSVEVDAKCGAASAEAVSGVSIQLLAGQTVVATTIARDGKFSFDNVAPGQYQLQASHPNWKFVKVRSILP